MNTERSPSPLGRHVIPDLPTTTEILPFLQRIDQNRWYSNFGPLVTEFEARVRSVLARSHAPSDESAINVTTVASGYCALEMAVRLLVPHRSGNVLLPAITFGACPLAIQHAGCQPVLVDVDKDRWTLTPEIARATADHLRVSAVMPVAIYGVPVPTDEWDAFSEETGIPVVVDAAAAFEAQAPLKQGLTAYSLHATKPFGVGEGGILAGYDHTLIEKARAYSNFGMMDHVCHQDGSNTKMSEYHAAVGLAQLARWPRIKQSRSELLSLYLKHLARLAPSVSIQAAVDRAVVSSLMLMLPPSVPETMMEQSPRTGIAFHRSYLPPLYRHPNFAHLPVVDSKGFPLPPEASALHKRRHMRNSETLLQRLLGMPFHPFMREDDVALVTASLASQIEAATPEHAS